MLQFLIHKHGTKLGNIIFHLKKLWTESPSTKVLIFSQVDNPFIIYTNKLIFFKYNRFLERIYDVLEADNIDYAFVEGYS